MGSSITTNNNYLFNIATIVNDSLPDSVQLYRLKHDMEDGAPWRRRILSGVLIDEHMEDLKEMKI